MQIVSNTSGIQWKPSAVTAWRIVLGYTPYRFEMSLFHLCILNVTWNLNQVWPHLFFVRASDEEPRDSYFW